MKGLTFYIVSVFILVSVALDSSANEGFTKYSIRTVVIDAGHGGKDPGCLGALAKEKDVTLSIALKLGGLIERNYPDIKVVYTRSKDEFIELNERAAIANRHKADLFISVHCNANNNKAAFGTETYLMGLHKTVENLSVAKRENEVVLMEDNYTAHYEGFDPSSPESHIIFSLYQNAFIGQSISLASKVQKYFEDKANRTNRGVKQAGFLVLWKTSMPSILIETGYLTNRTEEKFMASEGGQVQLASAIFHAFRDYKDEMEGNVSRTKEVQLASTEAMLPLKETIIENLNPVNTVKEEKAEKIITEKAEAPKTEVPKTEAPKTEAGNKNEIKHPLPAENAVPVKTEDRGRKMEDGGQKMEEPKKAVSQEEKAAVIFKVQFTVSDRVLNLKTAPYSKYKDVDMEKVNGIYKYMVGNYTSLEQATARQNEVRKEGFKGAFVVAYKEGGRITMGEAMVLLKKK